MDELRIYADRRLQLADMIRAALPMTSVITRVRYGSRPKAIVRRRTTGLGAEVPLAQVAGYIAQASATRAQQQVVSVEVEVPAEILRLGFEFIDTPGIGSAISSTPPGSGRPSRPAPRPPGGSCRRRTR
jgi:hypothetical protein